MSWVKYVFLVASVLALLSPVAANSVTPMQTACAPVVTVHSNTTSVTASSTSFTVVTGLTATSTLFIIPSTSVSQSTTCFLGTGATTGDVLDIITITFVSLLTVIGIPVPIPEYPFGMLILATIIIAAYLLLKRKVLASEKRSEST